jgi:glycosyltransferase involved in cell wall biosynthesis
MTSAGQAKYEGPRFSVIVPAFNAAATVRSAVESALSQTERDLEVIVVNDGSTDSTAEVVEQITDPRVKLVTRPNGGLPAARNTGIAQARGLYLGFLDSDDLWLPGYLELAAAALEATVDAGFAYTDAYAFDSVSGKVRRRTAMGRMRPPIPPPADRDAFLLELLERNFVYVSTIVPRSVLEVTGSYDESKRAAEDYELSLRILMHGYRAAWIPGQNALYRLHSGQMSRDPARMHQALLEVYRGLDMEQMPTPAHRDLLARRRRESERNVRTPMVMAGSFVPQRVIRSLKRAGIGESWYDPAPADVAAAFPDLARLS